MRKFVLIGQALGVVALASGAMAAPLISASGLDGAGVGLLPDQVGRAWGELAFHSQSGVTILAPTFGVGVMPIRQLELHLILPVSHISGENDSVTALGNIYLGATYVSLDGPLRATVGLGIALPTAPSSNLDDVLANVYGLYSHGIQHMALRFPGYTGVVVPLHLETGDRFVGTLDGSLQVEIPSSDSTNGQDTRTAVTLAPGVGFYASHAVIAGVRLPMWFYFPDDVDDHAQITVEPFVRFNLGQQGFLGVRFNVPVDTPLTELDMWGLHVGGGGAF